MSQQLDGASRLYPIIGDPVRYAESPVRLTAALRARGHDGVCIPMQVRRGDLGVVMPALTAVANVDGILVTMPHKADAFAYCTTSSQRAEKLAVISVMRRNQDGTWHGDTLDGLAFVKAQVEHGAHIQGARALLIGAGSAGSQIALALVEAGIRELVVHDANQSSVSALVELLAGLGDTRLSPGRPDPTGCDLVFNATPMGMEAGDPLPLDAALLTQSMFVGDVIAGHGLTPFVRAAQQAGCTVATGVDMVRTVQDLMADFMLYSEQ
jgi:shikimate dehydrogenase